MSVKTHYINHNINNYILLEKYVEKQEADNNINFTCFIYVLYLRRS